MARCAPSCSAASRRRALVRAAACPVIVLPRARAGHVDGRLAVRHRRLGPMSATAVTEQVILDRLLPHFDATVAVHRIVDGDPDAVYSVLMAVDLAEIPRSNPAVRALFAIRTAAERVVCTLRGRPAPDPDPGAQLRLADLEEHGEWVRLAEDAPRELAFGAIGRFWAGATAWETIDAAEFAAFDRPGFARTG